MGNFVSVCAKQEYEIKIDQLNNQVKSLNSTLKRIQSHNIELKQELMASNLQIDILEKKSNQLNNTLTHYKNILSNAESMSNDIIKSDLNCQWMDNDKEKEYLISIIEFINSSCNDISNNVSTKNRIKTKSISRNKKSDSKHIILKKKDTIDNLLDEINDTTVNFDSSTLSN